MVELLRERRAQRIEAVRLSFVGALCLFEHQSSDAEAALVLAEQTLERFEADDAVAAELPISAMELGGDYLGMLVEQRKKGVLEQIDYLEALSAYGQEVARLAKTASRLLTVALRSLGRYDGSNPEILKTCAAALEQSSRTWIAAACQTWERTRDPAE
jgi:hypothetical protein